MYSALITIGSVALFLFLAFVCVGLIIADPVGGAIFLVGCVALGLWLLKLVGRNEMQQRGGSK
jgi:hypothetical protein